mmetsp:Transcript_62350/g.167290  ORF Transcript_62350/g.167290 Transcript_62350/m.167290 type:complete len:112 (-) Transcript_62350:242-577(-)
MQYGTGNSTKGARRERADLMLAFAVVAIGLMAATCLVVYTVSNNSLRPISTDFQTYDKIGNPAGDFLAAEALMAHATDKQFYVNPPVPDKIADLAKEAEIEMDIDNKVRGN